MTSRLIALFVLMNISSTVFAAPQAARRPQLHKCVREGITFIQDSLQVKGLVLDRSTIEAFYPQDLMRFYGRNNTYYEIYARSQVKNNKQISVTVLLKHIAQFDMCNAEDYAIKNEAVVAPTAALTNQPDSQTQAIQPMTPSVSAPSQAPQAIPQETPTEPQDQTTPVTNLLEGVDLTGG